MFFENSEIRKICSTCPFNASAVENNLSCNLIESGCLFAKEADKAVSLLKKEIIDRKVKSSTEELKKTFEHRLENETKWLESHGFEIQKWTFQQNT